MKDTSLLNEIKSARRAKRAKVKYYVGLIVIVLALATTGAVTALHSDNKQDSKSVATTLTNQDQTLQVASAQPDPKPTQSPNPTPTTSSTVKSSKPTVDVNAVNAQLCKSIVNNAKATSDNYNKMYMDAWKGWNQNFAGNYDSSEAQANRDWYVNYIKKLYTDYISSANASYISACGPGGSVADVVFQPNYDSWQ